VLACKQVAITIRRAAGSYIRDIRFGDPVARGDLAQHERGARRHRIDRECLPVEIGESFDARRGDHRQEAAIAPHECEKIRVVGNLRLALAFLVGDEVVDQRQPDVKLALEQRSHEKSGIRRVGELDRHVLRVEESLALRRPDRQVPAAVERNHAQQCLRADTRRHRAQQAKCTRPANPHDANPPHACPVIPDRCRWTDA
jgi:hypothetical protein